MKEERYAIRYYEEIAGESLVTYSKGEEGKTFDLDGLFAAYPISLAALKKRLDSYKYYLENADLAFDEYIDMDSVRIVKVTREISEEIID
jgi:hypothetical protein